MKDKTKPCPFCGDTEIEDHYVYMKCAKCLAIGPQMNNGENNDHADYIDHANALIFWNRRIDE